MAYAYCVNNTSICDGIRHCAYGEDETHCITDCPEGCLCLNERMLYTCNASALPYIPRDAHGLDLSDNFVNMKNFEREWPLLVYLNLAYCDIPGMGIFQHVEFPILRILDLQYNRIESIPALSLPALEELYLRGNPIIKIGIQQQLRILSLPQTRLKYLQWTNDAALRLTLSLDVSYSNIRAIERGKIISNTFKRFGESVMVFLNLSHNYLSDITEMCYRCTNLTWLDLSYNKIELLSINSFSGISNLRYLSLRGNMISELTPNGLLNIHRIEELDLGLNNIFVIANNAFDLLPHLSILKIDHNRIDQLHERLFLHSPFLYKLNVANNKIQTVSAELFVNLKSLGEMNMSSNHIKFPKEKLFVHQYPLQLLDVRNNSITPAQDIFFGLSGLQELHVSSFSLCCIRPVHLTNEQCISDESLIPSCWELINLGIIKVFVWYAAVACLYGNGLAIVYRYKQKMITRSSRDLLITQLSVMDMLLAVYLIIIGTYDKYSQERYAYLDHVWRPSGLCTFAGVMVTWTNVASACFILAIAVEGFGSITWPTLKTAGYNWAVVFSIIIWIGSFITAVFPAVPNVTFPRQIYSSNGFCLPLPLTEFMFTNTDWEYSFGLLVVLKILIYVLTCMAQFMTYYSSRRVKSGDRAYDKRRQGIVAIRALAVIFNCGLCWIPTMTLGQIKSTFFCFLCTQAYKIFLIANVM